MITRVEVKDGHVAKEPDVRRLMEKEKRRKEKSRVVDDDEEGRYDNERLSSRSGSPPPPYEHWGLLEDGSDFSAVEDDEHD